MIIPQFKKIYFVFCALPNLRFVLMVHACTHTSKYKHSGWFLFVHNLLSFGLPFSEKSFVVFLSLSLRIFSKASFHFVLACEWLKVIPVWDFVIKLWLLFVCWYVCMLYFDKKHEFVLMPTWALTFTRTQMYIPSCINMCVCVAPKFYFYVYFILYVQDLWTISSTTFMIIGLGGRGQDGTLGTTTTRYVFPPSYKEEEHASNTLFVSLPPFLL